MKTYSLACTFVFFLMALVGCERTSDVLNVNEGDQVTATNLKSNFQDTPNHIVSAFFGLDNDLGPGLDGMPVNFALPIKASTLDAEDFLVIDSVGNEYVPHMATLRPANDVFENRTVLLVGEFGNNGSNPPKTIKIVDDLVSSRSSGRVESSCSKRINLKGQQTDNIIPLEEGPRLFFAQELKNLSRGFLCSGRNLQRIQVAWEGGIVPVEGNSISEEDLFRYYTMMVDSAGITKSIKPIGISDINDNDNYHILCVESAYPVVEVFFESGIVQDPNGDANPFTSIIVSRCQNND